MKFSRQPGLGLIVLAALLGSVHATPVTAQKLPHAPVRVGVVDSLFADVNPFLVKTGLDMFGTMLSTTTGMTAEMAVGGHAVTVGQNLNDGKLDLAVFHGVEFAWAQQRSPGLKPLMVFVAKYRHAQAQIVVRKEGPIADFDKLGGKTFAIPLRTGQHGLLFLERCCGESGQANPGKFFGEVVKPNIEKALDDVSYGNVHATVVDAVALERYQALKPGCFARLRVLKSSELFPAGVIGYRPGALGEDRLTRLRTSLLDAAKSDLGKELLQSFQITAFETVPREYDQMLSDILKIYPARTAEQPSWISESRASRGASK